jgi:hypothetical protein
MVVIFRKYSCVKSPQSWPFTNNEPVRKRHVWNDNPIDSNFEAVKGFNCGWFVIYEYIYIVIK